MQYKMGVLSGIALPKQQYQMEVKVENLETFSWKKVEETIELVFEEHPHASVNSEDLEPKNHDIHNLKRPDCDDAVMDSEVYVYHQEGTKEIFDGQARSPGQHKLSVKLEGRFDLDLATGTFLTLERTTLPLLLVTIDPSEVRFFEESSGAKENKLVVQVLFAQKSHATDREKYKIYKSGISGCTRKKYVKNEVIEFRNLKINYPSSLDKYSKIIIVLYHLTPDKRKIFRELLISKDLFIIEENKLMNIDNEEILHQYFDLFGSEFMDKLPTPFKANKSDRHAINEEIATLEKYLTKKNKKFLNVVYLSFKFPHFCELYFRLPEVAEGQDLIAAKRAALSTALTEAGKQVEELKLQGEKGELLCNYLNPVARLIFRINVNLRRVRIFMRKEFTEILSIVVSEEMAIPEGFSHFQSAKELKQFYLEYYSYARKCKTSQPFGKPNNSSAFLQNPTENKKSKKAEDDEYHEQEGDEEDESEGDEESNEGYSADKKAKKPNPIKKLYQPKKTNPGNVSPKQSKYPTRNKTRAQDCQESSNNESKRNMLAKKTKEKESQKKPQMPNVGMINQLNPMMPMPFQVMQQPGQPAMMGVFPMMQQNAGKKDGQPAQGQKMIPIGLPGMQMPGMGGISIAGMPGMPGMMPMGMGGFGGGMPIGIMPQPMGAKKDGNSKDGKEQQGGAKQGVPMMLPMMGGQGMQMPMMGMQFPMMNGSQMMAGGQFGMPMGMQGMQGMQGIPVVQGPNGQLMMMQMMPQQLQQMQQIQQMQASQNQNSSTSGSNTPASTSGQQQQQQTPQAALLQGGLPMGMMMSPGQGGFGGFQGMMLPQNMQSPLGMMGMGGSPIGVISAPGQPGSQPGSNPLGGLNIGQLQGMSGLPMSFMIPQQAQQQGDQKNGDKNGQKSIDQAKKNESGKKDEKSQQFPPPMDPNAPKGPIPSFLSPQGQFAAMIPQQGKDQKGQPQQIGLMPKVMAPGQMPQMISMPGMPGGGMVLTPEMLQQLQQGGQLPQILPGLTQLPQGLTQIPGGMQLPQGIQLPQGMQLPQGLQAGMMLGGGDPLAGLSPEQKQMMMQMQQLKLGGFPPGIAPQQPPKKDQEKK